MIFVCVSRLLCFFPIFCSIPSLVEVPTDCPIFSGPSCNPLVAGSFHPSFTYFSSSTLKHIRRHLSYLPDRCAGPSLYGRFHFIFLTCSLSFLSCFSVLVSFTCILCSPLLPFRPDCLRSFFEMFLLAIILLFPQPCFFTPFRC